MRQRKRMLLARVYIFKGYVAPRLRRTMRQKPFNTVNRPRRKKGN